MKKLFCILHFAFCICIVAQAQSPRTPRLEGIEWGAHAGLSLPHYRAAGFEVDNKLGWHAGLSFMFKFGALAVGPEVVYVRHSIALKHPTDGTKHIRANSVDVPLLVSLRALPILRIDAGPVFTVMNDCKFASGDIDMPFPQIRPTVGYVLGLGAEVSRHCVVGVRYYGQFAPKKCIYPGEGSESFRMRNYSLALSIGFVF